MHLPEQDPTENPNPELEQRAREFNGYATRVLFQYRVFHEDSQLDGPWGNPYLTPRESIFFARRFASHLLDYVVTNHAGRMTDVDPEVLDYLNTTQPSELVGYRPESREQILDEAASAVCHALVDEGESKRLILNTSRVLRGRGFSSSFPYPHPSSIWNVNKAFRDRAVPPRG